MKLLKQSVSLSSSKVYHVRMNHKNQLNWPLCVLSSKMHGFFSVKCAFNAVDVKRTPNAGPKVRFGCCGLLSFSEGLVSQPTHVVLTKLIIATNHFKVLRDARNKVAIFPCGTTP